jgi:predicted flap endonuclease-1-like 5' DNA nuclease
MAVPEEHTQENAVRGNSFESVALVVVAPLVLPALLLGLRPVAKLIIKGSLALTDNATHLITATSEGWSTLVAEARSRASTPPVPGGASAVAEPPQQAEEIDLQSITGIGSKWAALLQTAGVDTRHELARRHPAHLHEQLLQVNEQAHVVDLVPSLEQVTAWIAQAQGEAR